jgi:hypothetical protein
MYGQAPDKLHVEGVTEFWLKASEASKDQCALFYRPAVLIACTLNFRSLRAGLNHSEDHSYTAWLPEGDLPIDWDSPAAAPGARAQVTTQPSPDIAYLNGNYRATKDEFEQYEAELIDKLVRGERLRVFFNPVFGLFSAPDDAQEEFLARVAEAALGRVEPELKRLRNRFELQLEQVREARGAHAENLSLDALISQKLRLFESENRLAAMFSTLAGSVFGTTEPRPRAQEYEPDEKEMREDLDRVEQEASEALRALYSEYLSLANEYDLFEIGLQPDNIQVIRRSLLWVPAAGEAATGEAPGGEQ